MSIVDLDDLLDEEKVKVLERHLVSKDQRMLLPKGTTLLRTQLRTIHDLWIRLSFHRFETFI